jgi:prophage regulatory protein
LIGSFHFFSSLPALVAVFYPIWRKIMAILRLRDVQKQTSLSRSSIYLYMAKGQFPKQIKLGERMVGWIESDIQQWISDREQEARRAE